MKYFCLLIFSVFLIGRLIAQTLQPDEKHEAGMHAGGGIIFYIDATGKLGGFRLGDYCSSSEYGFEDAYAIHFRPYNRIEFYNNKINRRYNVRCIRKFQEITAYKFATMRTFLLAIFTA
jgi:hypothetical protein